MEHMDKSTIPEKLFCWNFQTEKGGWEKGWGGYCRATNLHPMDERERNTGAVYARLDLVKEKDTTDEYPSVKPVRRREEERKNFGSYSVYRGQVWRLLVQLDARCVGFYSRRQYTSLETATRAAKRLKSKMEKM
jgi:hypothetical protein